MKFAREINWRSNRFASEKRHGAAALSCAPLRPRGFGVRQPHAAFGQGIQSSRSNHASRITRHVTPVTNHRLRIPPQSAFTLAEVLAALVFMAILIPVALEALSIATRAGEVAARKGEAALVAERVLNENVVTTNWNKPVQSGSVQQGVREFKWTLHNDPWNEDPAQSAMRQLSVEVLYNAQGRDYSVRMSTLVDGTPPGTQSTQVQ